MRSDLHTPAQAACDRAWNGGCTPYRMLRPLLLLAAISLGCAAHHLAPDASVADSAPPDSSVRDSFLAPTDTFIPDTSTPDAFTPDTTAALDAPDGRTSWTERHFDHAPPPRDFAAMAYGSLRNRIIVHGGDPRLGDTWQLLDSTWTQLTGPTSPGVRSGHAMVYDRARNFFVLFGGEHDRTRFGDTWELVGERWVRRTPAVSPPARSAHVMAYDEARERVVLFGGVDADGWRLSDTWEYDGDTWTRSSSPDSPRPRSEHVMTYDRDRGVVIMYGGWDADLFVLEDTWEYDGTWTLVSTDGVGDVSLNGMVYSPQRRRCVLYTWEGRTFELDSEAGRWSEVMPVTSPNPRRGAPAMAYDEGENAVVLFGGIGPAPPANDYQNDMWLYR